MAKSYNSKYDAQNPFKKASGKKKSKLTPYNRSKTKKREILELL